MAVPDFSLLHDFCHGLLARISRRLTPEARDKPTMTSLHLLTVLFKHTRRVQETGRRAARALY